MSKQKISDIKPIKVELKKPNAMNDEWGGDNKMTSEFYDIPTLPADFVVDFMTNKMPGCKAASLWPSG